MSMDMAAMVGDVVPEIVLLVGGVMALLFSLFAPRRLAYGSAVIVLVALAAAAIVSLTMLDGRQYLTFSDTYARDAAAVWGKLIILTGTAMVVGLSLPWFIRDPRHGEYYVLLILSALGAVLMAGATDLKELVAAMLLSSATGFVLAAYHRASSAASEAGMKYFLVGALSNVTMLLGTAFLFGLTGSTTLPGLASGLAGGFEAGHPALIVAVALVMVGLAFKLGAVPAHAWVPDVAQGGPAPVAAFITSIPKVGAFIFTARLVSALPPDTVAWPLLMAALAGATMTLGNLASLWQDDVRRLLGWSSVSQTGYGLMAIAALGGSDLAMPSLLFFLLAYVLGNVAAFGVVVELRGRTSLADYTGLARARPALLASLAISFLSFIGVPPLAGFFAKVLLFAAAIEAGFGWLAVLAAVNTIVSIVYYVRVLAPAYMGTLSGPVAVLGRSAAFAAVGSAALVVVVGLAAEPFLRAFMKALALP